MRPQYVGKQVSSKLSKKALHTAASRQSYRRFLAVFSPVAAELTRRNPVEPKSASLPRRLRSSEPLQWLRFSRNCFGDTPVVCLKATQKLLALWYPHIPARVSIL